MIQRHQRGRRVRAATAEAPARRDTFMHEDIRALDAAGVLFQPARGPHRQVLLRRHIPEHRGAPDLAPPMDLEIQRIPPVDKLKRRLQ